MVSADEMEMIAIDQTDVIEILNIRFQSVPDDVIFAIKQIQKLDVLERLILVAANAADWHIFLEELNEGETSFRVLGERFDPINQRATDHRATDQHQRKG